jgi:hypothetical protein
MKELPHDNFYDCVDGGLIDANGKFSVCKTCIQSLYDKLYSENQSMEKTIHQLCIMLNMRFSNEAISATKTHIQTMLENGKTPASVFSIYKIKVIATQKAMAKNKLQYDGYEDISTIYTEKQFNPKELPIPQDVWDFWGKDVPKADIEFLETQYANFKQTHKADTYAEIVLLKQTCFTLLDIKNMRANGDDTTKIVRELQELMKNLAISPNVANTSGADKGLETFGLWIQDIEKQEPAQWLKDDPRGNMYRDVANIEQYFNDYIVRPIKNFITGSKDFTVEGIDTIDDNEEEAAISIEEEKSDERNQEEVSS